MAQPQLFPKPPKRMLQPRKDAIRLRAELAEAHLAYRATPRWWRLWRRLFTRLVETDPETAAATAARSGGRCMHPSPETRFPKASDKRCKCAPTNWNP